MFAGRAGATAIFNPLDQLREPAHRDITSSTAAMQPCPCIRALKVILIGNPMIYHLLYAADEDFKELFYIKADFDTRMDRTDDNTRDHLAFVCTFCRKEGRRHLEGAAAAKDVEHSSRLAGDQTKLSTRFAEINDLIREANCRGNREGSRYVKATHIQKAVEAKVHRSDLVQERLAEMTTRSVLLIDVDGEAVGQANGLAVTSLGDYAFGRPNRITASVGVGRGGILDIEREAKLGGPLHTSGEEKRQRLETSTEDDS